MFSTPSNRIKIIILLSLSLALLAGFGRALALARPSGPLSAPVAHLPIVRVDATPVAPHPAALFLQPVATITDFASDTVTDIANAGDDRLFVVLREGVIKVVAADGQIFTFLDIQTLANMLNWEQGLLGLAFHPSYPATPYFYVVYTSENQSSIVLARFTVSPGDPNTADPDSHLLLLEIPKPLDHYEPSRVHNGGDLNFGPDGYLYMSVGDGGPDPVPGSPDPGDPNNNSQRTGTLLGKILRIDVDSAGGGAPDCGLTGYTIPPGNPYLGNPAGACDEIWATGLRNPWRFSFDALTGNLLIGDVGEWLFEEVDFQAAGTAGGLNFGWHCYEGNLDYQTVYPEVGEDCGEAADYTFPVFDYPHPPQPESGCSVIGGFIYRGNQYLSLSGHYLLADYCSQNAWLLYQDTAGDWQPLFMGSLGHAISTFGEGVDGEIYVGVRTSDRGAQTIYHLTAP
ncbi:MAG: PQQ-dependent sugar dehydrogenase [Chloroflexota bacterium]